MDSLKLTTLLEKEKGIYNALKTTFPDMVKLAKEVEIIPWRDDFNIADKNPEVIEAIEFLDMLLQNKMITPEEYEKQLKKISTGYASKTMGIAFIDKKQVSFRSPAPHPNIDIVLHELGHIYFGVNDLLWNASYGGGEILFHLALQGKYKITEGHIRRYHALLEQIYEDPDGVHRLITDAIAPNIKVYPHLFPICIFAGYIPDFNVHEAFEFYDDLKSEKWATIAVSQHHLFSFFQNLTEGLKYNDSFWVNYAKWLGIIGG